MHCPSRHSSGPLHGFPPSHSSSPLQQLSQKHTPVSTGVDGAGVAIVAFDGLALALRFHVPAAMHGSGATARAVYQSLGLTYAIHTSSDHTRRHHAICTRRAGLPWPPVSAGTGVSLSIVLSASWSTSLLQEPYPKRCVGAFDQVCRCIAVRCPILALNGLRDIRVVKWFYGGVIGFI